MATKADLQFDVRARPDEPLPDLSMFPGASSRELSRYATPVAVSWMPTRVHILSSRHCRRWGALAPGSDFDVRRFLADHVRSIAPAPPHPELDWCGGELTLRTLPSPLIPTIRCVMPSLEQAGLAVIRLSRGPSLRTRADAWGLYATVAAGGAFPKVNLSLIRRTVGGGVRGVCDCWWMKRAVMLPRRWYCRAADGDRSSGCSVCRPSLEGPDSNVPTGPLDPNCVGMLVLDVPGQPHAAQGARWDQWAERPHFRWALGFPATCDEAGRPTADRFEPRKFVAKSPCRGPSGSVDFVMVMLTRYKAA